MLTRIIYITLLELCPAAVFPQGYTVSGYVKDSITTESLIGANIYRQNTGQGTSANRYGFYSLTLPAGETEIAYSYVGYGKATKRFNLQRDTVITVSLVPSQELPEVEITASAPIHENVRMSAISLPVAQIKALPALMGEADIMKTLQLMPGIQSGGEGTTGLYVRGGGPDQNLILLDGVPLYNVSHLFGFMSVFNADAVNNVEVFKGAFPARYGGRVSSVVDISMKEGNMQKFHGEGSIGLVASKITFEGPIAKDRTSFILSARRTYIDLIAKPLIASQNRNSDDKYNAGYYFYDVTAKVNHRFSDKDRIYLSLYMGDDKFYSDYETKENLSSHSRNASGLAWGNLITAFRWNHVFTGRLFANTTVTYSRYRLRTDMESWDTYEKADRSVNPPVYRPVTDYYGAAYQSGINDWAGQLSFDYVPSSGHYIRFGATATRHAFSPGALAFTSPDSTSRYSQEKLSGWEYGLYAEDDIKLTDRLKVNTGLYWSGFSVRNTFYNVLQPRISARYLLSDELSAKASYSRMAQYIHLLANSNVGLPTDLWVPATDRLQPQTSHHVAAGLARTFRKVYEISIEGYYKTMDNVLEYKEGTSFLNPDNRWEDRVLQGDGRSYGLELFIQKKTGSLTGWMGYTLSWTDRLFEELNNGRRFPYKYDRRHDFSIALIKRLNKKVELSGTWVFGTGNSISLPVGVYQTANPVRPNLTPETPSYPDYYDFGKRNGYRMAPYHRMDLSVSFMKETKWGERRWVFGVYNAYSRRNPYYIDVEKKERDYMGDIYQKYEYIQYSLFPIIPSISYQFKF
ncbi:TonB-dependent receptor [Bacteroidia bacterium]|nr:TonB-dependent receptor [Bacteroidia bacterium]